MCEKKVAIIVSNWRNFHQHRAYIVKEMGAHGMLPVIIGPHDGEDLEIKINIRTLFVKFGPPKISPINILTTIFQIVSILRRDQINLINAITLRPILISSFILNFRRLFGIRLEFKLVVTFAGLGIIFSNESKIKIWPRIRRSCTELFFSWLLRHRDIKAVFETEADRNYAVKCFKIRRERTFIINGTGVDLKVFYPGPKKNYEIKTILYAGRLLRSKGILEFISVAEKMYHMGLFKFVIAGWDYSHEDGLSPAEIKKLKSNSAVNYIDYTDDMPSLLRNTDLVVLPTEYPEGVPKILLEAAATNVPIITTDFPGAHVVVQNPRAGKILDSRNPDVILNAILNYFENENNFDEERYVSPRDIIKANNLSSEYICEEYLDIFKSSL